MIKLDAEETRSRQAPITEDMDAQIIIWIFERWGWVLFILLICTALLGVFSQGPLSSTLIESEDRDLRVDYERFGRNGSSTRMALSLDTATNSNNSQDEPAIIYLNKHLLEAFSIEDIQPQPLQARSHQQGVALSFSPGMQTDMKIYLTLRAEKIGFIKTTIKYDDDAVSFNQFTYP